MKGATFSNSGEHRYALWRIWDDSKPMVMVIGLNPSTANADNDDPTIRSVVRISKNLGYGGVYMMNCWPYISTDPSRLLISPLDTEINNRYLAETAIKCKDVIFAWGNFEVVRKHRRDEELKNMFPEALALQVNKNGSPKHPLYCKTDIKPIKYDK